MSGGRELLPIDVLIDLLGGADFDHEILDPEAAARLILDRLRDAGFEMIPARREGERLAAEISRIHDEISCIRNEG